MGIATPARRAFDQGRFKDAHRLLGDAPDPVLALEVSYFLGKTARAKEEIRRLASKNLSAEEATRCAWVEAAQSRDEGLFAEALIAAHRCVDLSRTTEDADLMARALAVLLDVECATVE